MPVRYSASRFDSVVFLSGARVRRALEPSPRRFPFFLIFLAGNAKLNGGGAGANAKNTQFLA
ncbi:hypothetical protein A2852_02650 [Candidatus Adlerbacteria bacterium RIFCSPHIGHO2_01_FULL_54_23]|uniref:Uncharacterized protein n=1 Tax=Candidatus Adlerbacteria bacterium RIFCSPLOWO2_01_FULL_54_16 TaxID=1797244 RepID=A0A1F4XZL5_9BACT|nr:MAG: hypothetical protein A2852_02650 [Candidatus Adlerbacteria bacterium RIFCSPHIGHO2_01_FULL_54_23]OGC87142.1 MAG: hypothetical protein A3B33_01010 [Candidatus Adlerbacteria bacterium RIFCSPLOWO2_01_FULL_54_16]